MAHTDVETERQAVVATVHDYFDGWYSGDADRMRRALHPALAKRAPIAALLESGHVADGDPDSLDEDTRDTMVEAAAKGIGTTRVRTPEERAFDVEVVDLYHWIATVVVRSPIYHEYLHLVRTSEGWRIANALWQRTVEGGDGAA
jgi:Putative lumazine-binding